MRALKVCLCVVGVFCLLAAFVMVLPFSVQESLYNVLGDEPLPRAKMFSHLIRGAGVTFFGVGIFYIILAWNPLKYGVLVPFSGAAAVLFGLWCGVSGLVTRLHAFLYVKDSLGALILGILIIVFWRRSAAKAGSEQGIGMAVPS